MLLHCVSMALVHEGEACPSSLVCWCCQLVHVALSLSECVCGLASPAVVECHSPETTAATVLTDALMLSNHCCYCRTFKRKAARAVREIKKFASNKMHTTDVRIDANLNKFIWSKGVRNVPYRVRVRLSRKRTDDDEADEKVSPSPSQPIPVCLCCCASVLFHSGEVHALSLSRSCSCSPSLAQWLHAVFDPLCLLLCCPALPFAPLPAVHFGIARACQVL